jgi:hypothetical protein
MFMVVFMITGIVITFFILFSFFVPIRWRVKEMLIIKTSSDELYESLLHVKRWPKWQMDENAAIPFMYVGPDKGEGASQYWETDGVPASLRIDRCDPGKSIHYQIRINKGETNLRFAIIFCEDLGSPKLTWVCEGTSKKNPFERYMTFFYKWKMKQEMKMALLRLKTIYERQLEEIKQSA